MDSEICLWNESVILPSLRIITECHCTNHKCYSGMPSLNMPFTASAKRGSLKYSARHYLLLIVCTFSLGLSVYDDDNDDDDDDAVCTDVK